MELTDLAGEKFVSLTTYRRNGESSAKPVWIAPLGDGRLGFTTGEDSLKVKRIRNDDRVQLQPCDMRGSARDGTSPLDANAAIAGAADEARARAALAKKYGLQYKMLVGLGKIQKLLGRAERGGCAVIITPRTSTGA